MLTKGKNILILIILLSSQIVFANAWDKIRGFTENPLKVIRNEGTRISRQVSGVVTLPALITGCIASSELAKRNFRPFTSVGKDFRASRLSKSEKYFLKRFYGNSVQLNRVRVMWGTGLPHGISVLNIPGSSAQTFGYNIYMRGPRHVNNVEQLITLAHELNHTMQAAHLGGVARFCTSYMTKYVQAGYSYDRNQYEKNANGSEDRFRKWLVSTYGDRGYLDRLPSVNYLIKKKQREQLKKEKVARQRVQRIQRQKAKRIIKQKNARLSSQEQNRLLCIHNFTELNVNIRITWKNRSGQIICQSNIKALSPGYHRSYTCRMQKSDFTNPKLQIYADQRVYNNTLSNWYNKEIKERFSTGLCDQDWASYDFRYNNPYDKYGGYDLYKR